MLIYIDPTIVEYFQTTHPTPDDLEALDNIISSHRKSYHYLFSSRRCLEYLSGIDGISDLCKKQLGMLSHDYTTFSSITNAISTKVVVLPPTSRFRRIDTVVNSNILGHQYTNSIFEIPLLDFLQPEILEKTKLVSEHLDDCYFYEYMAENFSENKHLPFSVAFDPDHGGGNDTHRVFEDKVKNNHIAIVLVDSDKNIPTGEIGTTGKQVLEVYKNYKKSNIVECEVLPVHEKENLFSSKVYENLGNNIREQSLLQLKLLESYDLEANFLTYLDYKKGLHSDNYQTHFESLFHVPNLIPSEIDDRRNFDKEYIGGKDEFISYTEQQKKLPKSERNLRYLIAPLSNNPMGHFNLKELKQKLEEEIGTLHPSAPVHLKENIEIKIDVIENMPEYLLDYQKKYFAMLGTRLKEWGLSNLKRSAY